MAQDWLGHNVKLFFQDTEKVILKRGRVLSADALFLKLDNANGVVEMIPMARVVRVEVIR